MLVIESAGQLLAEDRFVCHRVPLPSTCWDVSIDEKLVGRRADIAEVVWLVSLFGGDKPLSIRLLGGLVPILTP